MLQEHMTAAEYRKMQGLQPAVPAQKKTRAGGYGRARLPKNGRHYDRDAMNKIEADYAAHLDAQADVIAWKYEGLKFRLAERTYYTPDFLVIKADGSVEVHEVKGHWEDDARVKVKTAAETYPFFIFRAIQKAKGGVWKYEDFRKG